MMDQNDILVFKLLTQQPQSLLVHPRQQKMPPPSRINNAFWSRHEENERGRIHNPSLRNIRLDTVETERQGDKRIEGADGARRALQRHGFHFLLSGTVRVLLVRLSGRRKPARVRP
jgi:hypothetical protein